MNTQEQTKQVETAEELKRQLDIQKAQQNSFIGGFIVGGIVVASAAALGLLAGRRQ